MDRGKGKAPDASFIPSQPETPAPEWELPDDGEGGFHAVEPKLDCPHINSAAAMAPLRENMVLSVDQPCSMCGTGPENWFCLKCHQVFCSRWVKSPQFIMPGSEVFSPYAGSSATYTATASNISTSPVTRSPSPSPISQPGVTLATNT